MAPATLTASPNTTDGKRRLFLVLAFAGLMAAEFVILHRFVAVSQSSVYPRWTDQAQYLGQAYRAYEYTMGHGFIAGIWHALAGSTAQGVLHELWAAAAFSAAGPSRAAALDLNLLWFLALQASIFVALRRVSGTNGAAWLSIGLLWAMLFPWSGQPGSAADFRLDWMAACAYGAALCAAIMANGFRSTRWAATFGVAVGVVVLARFLSAVYFALILACLGVVIPTGSDARPRRMRLLLSAFVALAMAGPVLWLNRQAILVYYWGGHIAGPESALRDAHLGPLASVRWLGSELVLNQLGVAAIVYYSSALAAFWALGSLPATREGAPEASRYPLRGALWATLIFLFAPAVVLCVDPAKASQAASVMLAPTVVLVALACVQASRRVRRGAAWSVAAGVFIFGAAILVAHVALRPVPEVLLRDTGKVNALCDYLFFRAEECALEHPKVAQTLLSDGLSAGTISVVGYERHGHILEFEQMMPTGLLALTLERTLQVLGASDFVCLVSRPDTDWPFDRQMMANLPVVRPWCEVHLVHVADLDALGASITVYERRGLVGPAGASAVNLSAMLAESEHAPMRPRPPSAPVFVSPRSILCSSEREILAHIRAAYSPITYRAAGLPPGVLLDPRTGTLHGATRVPGNYLARVSAANSAGTAESDVTLIVGKGEFLTRAGSAAAGRVGVPTVIEFEAFSAGGTLDFIDVSDLTTGALIARVEAGREDRTCWQGGLPVTFDHPGAHSLVLRFVRFDPAAAVPYSFRDEGLRISISR